MEEQPRHPIDGTRHSGHPPQLPKRPRLKGRTFRIKYNSGPVTTFRAGYPTRRATGEDFAAHSAEFLFADGTHHYGVVELCEADQGEHYGSGILLADGTLAFQGEPDFLATLGKTRDQVFPYRYHYFTHGQFRDIHVGEDGWST
jgi:hypothetical protein